MGQEKKQAIAGYETGRGSDERIVHGYERGSDSVRADAKKPPHEKRKREEYPTVSFFPERRSR